jgi:hypothetical protein
MYEANSPVQHRTQKLLLKINRDIFDLSNYYSKSYMGKRRGDSGKKRFFCCILGMSLKLFRRYFNLVHRKNFLLCARPKNVNWYWLLLSPKNIQTICFDNYSFGDIYIIVIKIVKIERLLFAAN